MHEKGTKRFQVVTDYITKHVIQNENMPDVVIGMIIGMLMGLLIWIICSNLIT